MAALPQGILPTSKAIMAQAVFSGLSTDGCKSLGPFVRLKSCYASLASAPFTCALTHVSASDLWLDPKAYAKSTDSGS